MMCFSDNDLFATYGIKKMPEGYKPPVKKKKHWWQCFSVKYWNNKTDGKGAMITFKKRW